MVPTLARATTRNWGAGTHELQAVVGGRDRLVGGRDSAGETRRGLVVLAERDVLQRIRLQIADSRLWERPVDGGDRNEAGNVGERISDAGAVVVVVREPALRVRVIERGREGHAEPVRKGLIYIGP